jgi:hypothetical protein
LGERLHAYKGRALTHDLDDFADPDFPGAAAAARAVGLPYLRGGTLEMGGTQLPLDEASNYQELLQIAQPNQPFGTSFKELMRASLLRDRLLGITMVGEDLPYAANRVTLDSKVKDWRGLPVARITYGPGTYEVAARRSSVFSRPPGPIMPSPSPSSPRTGFRLRRGRCPTPST